MNNKNPPIDHLAVFLGQMRPPLEAELIKSVEPANGSEYRELHHMLSYHMGWVGEDAGPESQGKRIRPILLLLTTASAGEDWHTALPAAAAIELVHNFSLIHDDIEDNSHLRRGRVTLWSRWGIPQAINAGDALFTLAHLAMLRLASSKNQSIVLRAASMLQQACLELTQGQYLDLAYEKQTDLTIEQYWPMVRGKTAALLSACTAIGAVIADSDEAKISAYQQFGHQLGLAFQVLDDILGIWGDSEKTGKSSASDLVAGKKSLPVLYGLSQNGSFADRWHTGPIQPQEATYMAELLSTTGAREYAQSASNTLTQRALGSLEEADPQGEAGVALYQLAHLLLDRHS